MWLIIGRALQGFATALIPVGISIMRDELPKEKMGSAVALMSATLGIGSALGLPLAGVLYESLGWESIFWVSAAAGSLLLAAVRAGGSRSPRCERAADSTMSAPWCCPRLWLRCCWPFQGRLLGLGLRAGAAAVPCRGAAPGRLGARMSCKVSQPMVDLRTSARRPVLLTNLASLLIGFAMFANMLLTTQQLQLPASTGYGFELSVITAGLCMVPSGLAMVVFAPVSGRHHPALRRQDCLMAGAVGHDCGLRGPRLSSTTPSPG